MRFATRFSPPYRKTAAGRIIAPASAAVAIPLAVILLITPGCSRKKPAPPPRAPVVIATVAGRDVPLQITAIGNVEFYSSVQVKALVGGQMLAAHFKEGQDVKRGDLLFTIDPRPFEISLRQAEATLARDQALAKNAEDDLSRYTELVRKDYVTQEAYEQLKANLEQLRATLKGDLAAVDNARLQLGYCTIRSPINGRTGALLVYPGNLVKANDTSALVVMNQITPIYVSFSVPQQSLPLIKTYQSQGLLKTEVVPQNNAQPISGSLTFIDNAVDATTGTILLKATFDNADRALWPGQYLNVILTLTIEKNRIVVPSQAVQTGQAGHYVMVIRDDLTAESRPVEVERTQGDVEVIRSGLKAGEKVVTDGLLRLTTGTKVEIRNPGQEAP
jgi:multidrug efflux system membrane fusion protein